MSKKKIFGIALLCFVLGIAAALFATQVGTSEKTIDTPIERLYDVRDPQFERAMSVLLGPPLLPGNQVEVRTVVPQAYSAVQRVLLRRLADDLRQGGYVSCDEMAAWQAKVDAWRTALKAPSDDA